MSDFDEQSTSWRWPWGPPGLRRIASRLSPSERLSRSDFGGLAAIALIGLLVFLPGLGAGFVSEDFDFYRAAHNADLHYIVNLFVPNNYTWYRPLNDLGFWIEVQIFGLNPVAFHAVSLAGHIVSASLLYAIARKLGCRPGAAFVTGLVFVTSVHAHEIVWWWSDSHYAFGGPVIVGSILAWLYQRKPLAVLLTGLALLTDESAVLLLPLAMVGEFLVSDGSATLRDRILRAVRAPISLMILIAMYFAYRIAIGRGIAGESKPCHSAPCIAAGLANYASRLALRPDRAFVIYGHYKVLLIAVGVATVASIAFVVITRWHDRRSIAFGIAWTTLTVIFFVLALWPYASDRFMYYPDMGLALVFGGVAEEALYAFSSGKRNARIVAVVAGLALIIWIGAGIRVLELRASGWVRAGNQASTILDNVREQIPNPPHDLLLDIEGAPDSSEPAFPPGNTGPYLFRNGLEGAIRLRFNSEDIWVAWAGHVATSAHSNVLHLKINPDNSVAVLSGP